MGVGEYETRIALEGSQRQEAGIGQGTRQRASPGQNVMGFGIHKEHHETQMKAKTEYAKTVQEEQDAKARWDMVKRFEAKIGAGCDGTDEAINWKREYGKMKEGELDAQARWEKLKRLDANMRAGVGGDGKNEFMEFEKHARNVDPAKMKMDYEKVVKEQKDVQARWPKLKHL